MKYLTLIFLFSLLLSNSLFSQEDFLAKQYFNDGDFKKAVVYYERLVKKNPRRTDYAEGLMLPTNNWNASKMPKNSFSIKLMKAMYTPLFISN